MGHPLGSSITNDVFTLTPGANYRFSFYVKSDGSHIGKYRIYDVTNGAEISGFISTGVTETSYQSIQYDFIMPSGCTQIRWFLYAPNTLNAYSIFDNVSLRKVF